MFLQFSSSAPEGIVEKDAFGTAEEVAEKRRQGRKSSPQALKRGHIFSGLAARLKSGPSQNLRESYFFRNG
jgi:hypothetical protein